VLTGAVDRSPHGGLQLASSKAGGAYTNTVAHESQKICLPQKFLGWLRHCYTNVQNQEILYRIKWEVLLYKGVRKTFVDSVSSLFRELPEWTAGHEVQ